MDDKQVVLTVAKDLLVAAIAAGHAGAGSHGAKAGEDNIAKIGELYEALTQSVAKTAKALKDS